MKYEVIFAEQQIPFVIDKFPKATIIEQNERWARLELEINSSHDLFLLFFAGANYQFNQIK
jgi:hypothetical protein